jgi:hypothetical protein
MKITLFASAIILSVFHHLSEIVLTETTGDGNLFIGLHFSSFVKLCVDRSDQHDANRHRPVFRNIS